MDQMEKGNAIVKEEAAPALGPVPAKGSKKILWTVVTVVAALVGIGLIVGLSAGLTSRNSKTPSVAVVGPDVPTDGATSPAPTPSPVIAQSPTSPTTSQDDFPTFPPTPSPTPTPTPAPTDPTAQPVESNDDTVPNESQFYQSSSDRDFDVRLRLLSSAWADGYTDPTELEKDLMEAVKFACMMYIESQAGLHPDHYFPYFVNNDGRFFEEELAADVNGPPGAGKDQSVTGPSAAGINDYGTNNQEDGVDEADRIKANTKHTFIAYGDILTVYDVHTGDWVSNVTMEPIYPELIEDVIDGKPEVETASFSFWRNPSPQIVGLLLNEDRLVVIVRGYAERFRNEMSGDRPAFYQFKGTRIKVYDISGLASSGELVQVFETDVNGDYRDGRSIGNKVHLVSSTDVDYWNLIAEPLGRYWNPSLSRLPAEEYKAAATLLANDEVIPMAVQKLMESLQVNEQLPNLFQIGLYEMDPVEGADAEGLIFDGVAFSAYTQVASFDMSGTPGSTLQIRLAGAFMPNSWGFTYANTNYLFFAGQGWNWNPELGGSAETSYFMGFKLSGEGELASATPKALGSTPGRILDQYSMDEKDGYLRVATTIRAFWPWWWRDTDEEEPLPRPESLTQNQLIILNIPEEVDDRAIFRETGRIANIGKADESITACSIFDDVAYVVTFLRTDPFYVLNLEDPTSPFIQGELQIPGWSDQLMSMNDDNTLLAAIGHDADENGTPLSFSVSIFDATVPTDPQRIHFHAVEDDESTFSGSSASWDRKAIRLTMLPSGVGLLTVPLRIHRAWPDTEGNFDGYVVWNLSRDGITQRFNVSHVPEKEGWYGCYYPAYLPDRSLIHNGNLTTFKTHSILTTDLDTAATTWTLNMPKPEVSKCQYWLPRA